MTDFCLLLAPFLLLLGAFCGVFGGPEAFHGAVTIIGIGIGIGAIGTIAALCGR